MKKYGRTYHLPISPGVMSDDKILRDLTALTTASEVVFTEKMDGENTTIHHAGCHARSPDSGYHASRDWVKALAAGISPNLATNERIVGEYLFARHSVAYDNLQSYFIGFAWIIDGTVQAWDATLERFSTLGIQPVSVLHRGPFNDAAVNAVLGDLDLSKQEGFVVRTTSEFQEANMATHMAKYVRADHVQSETHWMRAEIVKNELQKD
ncbi:MAG: RNA ligase family protein [Sulfitobacter sp.]